MDNQNLFDQTYSQILAKLAGQGISNFQLLGSPINFSWPVAPMGQTALQAQQLADMMPKWSPVGTLQPGDASFFSAYRRVMGLVQFKVSPDKQGSLQGLADQYTKANNDLQSVSTGMNSAFQTARQNGGEGFTALYPAGITDWLKGPGSTFVQQMAALTTAVKSLGDQYAAFMTDFGTDPTLMDDFKLMATPTVAVSAAAPSGWTKVANADGSLSWAPLYNLGKTGQDWRAQLASGTQGAFELTLDASKSSSDLEHTWAGAEFKVDTFFWGVSGSSSWDRLTQLETDNSVTASIKVKSSTIVPVTAGAWYDTGLMRNLALSKLADGVSLVPPWTPTGNAGDSCVFGSTGLLAARVNGLVVVYQPSYSITMASSTYDLFHQRIEAKAGVRIGPFTFGGQGGNEQTKVSTTGNRTTLTSTSTSNDPLIIGVTVAFPGLDAA